MVDYVGQITFVSEEDGINAPTPKEVLDASTVRFNETNAPFLLGRTPKPDHSFRELSTEEVRRSREGVRLSDADAAQLIGDYSQTLSTDWKAMIVRALDFVEATRLAALLGYRPARLGEYLQLVPIIRVWGHAHG